MPLKSLEGSFEKPRPYHEDIITMMSSSLPSKGIHEQTDMPAPSKEGHKVVNRGTVERIANHGDHSIGRRDPSLDCTICGGPATLR